MSETPTAPHDGAGGTPRDPAGPGGPAGSRGPGGSGAGSEREAGLETIETMVPAAGSAADPRLLVRAGGVTGYGKEFMRRVKGGELGARPVIAARVPLLNVVSALDS